MIKQRTMLTEIPEVKYIRHTTRVHRENLHILAVVRQKYFLEN